MRQLKPYQTVVGARAALDNGGRFYDLIARAGDDRVSKGELAKAAGVFRSEEQAFLFLSMALADLSDRQRSEVLSRLEPALARRYRSAGPRLLEPHAVDSETRAGDLVVVEGHPRFVARTTERPMMPLMVGKVIVLVPVENHYDGYELFASAGAKGTPASLVVKRPRARLAERFTRFGGAIRASTVEDSSGKRSGVFLEPLFYTDLEP